MKNIFILTLLIFSLFQKNYSQKMSTHKTVWELLGPAEMPEGKSTRTKGVGLVSCIKANPKNFDEIYLGTQDGGFWKTENGGKTWTCKTNKLPGAGYRFAVHPNDFKTIFVTTGVNATSGSLLYNKDFGDGLYKTSNGGKSWKKLAVSEKNERLFLNNIKISPHNSDILFASSKKAVYKSSDAGKTWIKKEIVKENEIANIQDIHIPKLSGKFLFVTGQDVCMKISDNFEKKENLLPLLTDTSKRSRSIISSYKDTLYALVTQQKTRHNIIYKSGNKGKTWEKLIEKSFSGRMYVLTMEISPKGDIYAGGISLYRSENKNYSKFIRVKKKIHDDIRTVNFPDKNNSNLVFAGTDGGIAKSINGGETWEYINGNLSASQVHSIAISDKNPNLIIAGLSDCGTIIRRDDGKWHSVFGCDGGTCLIDYSDISNIWICCNKSVLLSKTDGKSGTFRRLKGGKRLSAYDPPIVQHPKYPDTIFIGSSRLIKYSEYGNKKEGSFNKKYIEGRISALAISKSNPNIIYFASDGKFKKTDFPTIYRNENGINGKYLNIGEKLTFIKNKKIVIKDIIIHPKNHNKLWICVNGFLDNKKVFYSENGGKNWKNISYNLENFPVNQIIFEEKTETVFLGSDIGVFCLQKGKNKWKIMSDFPNVIVSDLKINNKTNELYVATYGRGIWKTKIKIKD